MGVKTSSVNATDTLLPAALGLVPNARQVAPRLLPSSCILTSEGCDSEAAAASISVLARGAPRLPTLTASVVMIPQVRCAATVCVP